MGSTVLAELIQRVCQACAAKPGIASAIAQFDAMEAQLRPSIGRVGGDFLASIGAMTGIQQVLELGTFLGYSSLRLASHGAHVTSIERSSANASVARQLIQAAGAKERIEVLEGDASRSLSSLLSNRPVKFDALFIDHAKKAYLDSLIAAEPFLRPGAIVIADNVLSKAPHLTVFLKRLRDPRLYRSALTIRLPPRDGRAAPDALHLSVKV